jgi:SAM-dependent methyltransferase
MVMPGPQDAETWVNAAQAAGRHRIRQAGLFDAETHLHNLRFRAATGAGRRDRVLDIGCGAGQSTREAARAAADGSVVGVDLSAPLLELARRLTEEEGLRNVTYLQADAQLHRFPPRHFDLCISRFGVMFFADPVAAFTSIGSALRPGARLVAMVWQDGDRNEWWAAIRQSLAADPAAPVPPASGPRMFSLADPAAAAGILTAAGFTEVSFTDVHEPVYYGPDTSTACDFVLGFRDTRDLLAGLDTATARHALERLRVILAEHDTGSGVFFDSRAWIITARR